MSKIARSTSPLYQTRNRPVMWPVLLTDPQSGQPINLTGASAAAALVWNGNAHQLTVSGAFATDGALLLSAPASLVDDFPLGPYAELQLTVTDSQGGVTDYVWPVEGETP